EADADLVFQFSQNFAEVNPEKAAEILNRNAQKLEVPAPSVDPSDAQDAALFAATEELVSDGFLQGLRVADTLAGYDYDAAYPRLLRNLLFPGVRWFVLAAITGAVISSLASMLNSASTIFTMDIANKVVPGLSQGSLVKVGRTCVVLFTLIACLI